MEMTRKQVVNLITAGHQAARNGETAEDCPFNRDGDVENQFGHRYWTKGFAVGRRTGQVQLAAEPAQELIDR